MAASLLKQCLFLTFRGHRGLKLGTLGCDVHQVVWLWISDTNEMTEGQTLFF